MKLNRMCRFGALLMSLVMAFSLVTLPAAAAGSVTVTLNKTTLTLAENATETLTATVKVNGTAVSGATVTWSSDKPAIVGVFSTGKVNAKKEGTATITATYTDPDDPTKTGSASCTVTVTKAPVPVTSIALTGIGSDPLTVGSSATLTATLTPEDATEALKWSVVGAADVVTLTPNGSSCTATAKKPGEVTVKVATEDGAHSAECTITVSGIVLDASSLDMITGDTQTLTARSYGKAPAASTIVWTSTNISVAEVTDGRVRGHYPGTATITAAAGAYKATCTVTVKEDVADAVDAGVVDAGAALSFSGLVSTLNSRSHDKTESALSYVSSLQVSPNQGVLYYGYVSADNPGTGVGSENYYASPGNGQLDLRKISFAANPNFSGTAVISYTGRGTNGRSFNGTIRVNISAAGDVYYSTSADQPVYFEAADFSSVCMARTGKDITSISFVQPSSKAGVLYYNYGAANVYNPEVSTDISLYRTKAPYLDDVVFVPNKDYSGSVDITYYCTTSAGTYTGKVTIDVAEVNQQDEGRITYNVASGGRVDLNADDFNRLCLTLTNAGLSYVYFDLPSAVAGTLYYNYNSAYSYGGLVSENTRYFRTGSPRISYVTFVAAGNYSGNVSVPFTGYSTSGTRFSGEVVFCVDDGHDGVISYRSDYGETIYFEGADFNELCLSLKGKSLDYVCFEQPASSRGTLYRGTSYNSSTKLSSTTRLYRSGNYPYRIDDVVFVPSSSYTGTFDIPFSGYDVSGGRFSGVVQISVERRVGSLVVTYQTVSGGLVGFHADDFNTVCQLKTGERLNYVQFRLPSSSAGRLYYNYNSSSGTGTSVYASTNYYRTNASQLLDDVSFRAAESYTGTLTLEYTGVSMAGTRYSGAVEIVVAASDGTTVSYTGSSVPIQLKTADFESAYTSQTGRKLSYIRFSELPSAAEGTLYWNYTSSMQRGTAVKTATSYYVSSSPSIGQITFVPKAGYQGYTIIPFTGVDTSGRSVAGTLRIEISNWYCPSHFSDMTGYETQKPSVEFLYDSGVVKGYVDGTYGPGRSISRGEFTVMVYRAFELPDAGSSYSFPDVPTDSFCAKEVAAAKALGIVQGNGKAFLPENTITRQDAMTVVLRAMEATGKTVPNVSASILSSYTDGAQVSSYARTAVSTMVYLGAVDINAARQIRPYDPLTRAEMAVLLHYILTQ